jgi:Pyridoxamine 5'-phosphate oxidase
MTEQLRACAPQQPTSDLAAVVDDYRTCEFATLDRDGMPVAWPVLAVRRPDGTFVTTTSIAFPRKAANIGRDHRVAMLFSDPTGSGIRGAPELLIQGSARVSPEVTAGPAGAEDVWRRVFERQPRACSYGSGPISRWLTSVYFMRLVITVTPTAVDTRPALAPLPRFLPLTGPGAVLSDYPTLVLGTRDCDGTPRLQRVRIAGRIGHDLVVDLPDGYIRPGPASLLGHAHDENLWHLSSAVLLGEIVSSRGRWLFRPTRAVVGGARSGGPLAQLRALHAMRRTAAGYLARHGMSRPAVAWAEFEAIRRSVPGELR